MSNEQDIVNDLTVRDEDVVAEPLIARDIPDPPKKRTVSKERDGMTMVGVGKRSPGRKEHKSKSGVNTRRGIHKVYNDKPVSNVGKGTNSYDTKKRK